MIYLLIKKLSIPHINYILTKLDKKYNLIQNNQINIEKKLDEKLDLIKSEQNNIKNEINKNIQSIKTLNISHEKLENIINQNTETIKKIERYNIPYNISTVVNKFNINSILQLSDYILKTYLFTNFHAITV